MSMLSDKAHWLSISVNLANIDTLCDAIYHKVVAGLLTGPEALEVLKKWLSDLMEL